jgi:hypothetical protein
MPGADIEQGELFSVVTLESRVPTDHPLRQRGVTPQVAQNLNRPGGSAIDARTTRHTGYQISQRFRKRIEECFGWGKQDRLLRRPKLRGREKIGWLMELSMIGYNMVRMSNLMAAPAQPH